ncbi:hypothetical protein AB0K74_29170 [Streptomyces sp. NPDC056159]
MYVITGGDLFQRPDLLELIGYGEEAGVRVAVPLWTFRTVSRGFPRL